MSYSDFPAAKIINDTDAHTGRFGKVVALQDSVITLVSENVTGDLSAVPFKSSNEICVITKTLLWEVELLLLIYYESCQRTEKSSIKNS